MRKYDRIFVRQNIFIKIAILILGSINTLVLSPGILLYLFLFVSLYLLLSPEQYKTILRSLILLMPFYASYALFATVFGLDYIKMLVFLLRITMLLYLVVIFAANIHLQRVLEDIVFLQKHNFFRPVIYYSIATILFLNSFSEYYQKQTLVKDKSNRQVGNSLTRMIDAIHNNWLELNIIQEKTDSLIRLDYKQSDFITKSNVLGCILITLLILLLSV